MLDIERIKEKINKDGAVFLPNYFSTEETQDLINSFDYPLSQGLNNNICGPVYYLQQKFISQSLVHSRPAFNFISGDIFFGLCKSYLEIPTIKAIRYYETGAGGISMWHHDEKNNGYTSKGLIGIIYLNDVLSNEDGPFEYINSTHRTSLEMADSDFFSTKINQRFKENIVTCLGPRGSLILADSSVIHRARPHCNNFSRKSIFIQVSKLTSDIYKELILVNPSFLNKDHFQDEMLMNYLGFGLPCEKNIYPPTNITHLPFNNEIFRYLSKWIYTLLKQRSFETLPKFLKVKLRKIIGRPVDYDAQKK